MRKCWTDHDSCTINCPCNEECPEGCPVPSEGHSCKTWFCQGYVMACATEVDSNREKCEYGDQYNCEYKGCCWTPYTGPNVNHDVPWCHQPKKQQLQP